LEDWKDGGLDNLSKESNNPPDLQTSRPPENNKSSPVMSDFIYAAGIILGLSYPILAFSTGGRAVYQLLFKQGVTDYLPPVLSAMAATCYLLATIGFFKRRKWAWWLSVSVLGFETTMTFVVGTLSFIIPAVIGRTVWRHFGIDYGFFPLFQPLLGLFWLFSRETLQAYGISLWKRTAR
jgi:hypothetical protein